MKKLFCVFLTVLCCFSIASCKKEPFPINTTPKPPDNPDAGINWLVAPEKQFEDIQAMDFYYDTTNPQSQYLTFQKDGKWGVLNDKLEIVLDAKSDEPAFFCTMGHLHIQTNDNRADTKFEKGIEIVGGHGSVSFIVVYNVNDGLIYGLSSSEEGAEVVLLSNYAYTLPNILPFEYVNLFYDDFLMSYSYESEFRFGYCDEAGNVLTQQDYDYAQPFTGGVAAVMQDGKWGYIDQNFQKITNYKYQPCFGATFYNGEARSPFFAYSMCDGYAPVMINAKYGVIDKNGEEVLPCTFDKILPMTGGRALIKYDGKWGIADLK